MESIAVSDKEIKKINMKYSHTKRYGFPQGPRDTSFFEMQIATYAHCPSEAQAPIDRLKQILLIIEYLMAIIKSSTKILTPISSFHHLAQETQH